MTTASLSSLTTFLYNPLTFSTFHTWSSTSTCLGDTADFYFETFDKPPLGWSKELFRNWFVQASLEEQLAIHEILNIENPDLGIVTGEGEVKGHFWVEKARVEKIRKWFSTTSAGEEVFGKVVLQLTRGEVEVLLKRVEELEEIGRSRRERGKEKRKRRKEKKAEQKRSKNDAELIVSTKKNSKRRTRCTGHIIGEKNELHPNICEGDGVNGAPNSFAADFEAGAKIIDSKRLKSVDLAQPTEKLSEHEQVRASPTNETPWEADSSSPVTKPEAKMPKKRRRAHEDDGMERKERKKARRQNCDAKKAAKAADNILSVEESGQSENSNIPPVTKEITVPKEFIEQKRVLDSLLVNPKITKQCNTHTSSAGTPSTIVQKYEDSSSTDVPVDPPIETPRRKTRSQTSSTMAAALTTTPPKTLKTPTKRSPTKSPFFVTPIETSSSKKKTTPRPAAGTSCIPFPPLSSCRFGLSQEPLAHSPFYLLLAVQFLNKTKGSVAMPVFRSLIDTYPTPALLAAAQVEDIVPRIRHLGLQNQRAVKIISLAKRWIHESPVKGKRYRTLHYPVLGAGRDIKPTEVLGDEDEREGAWEVAHLPGCGDYAIDSWRIFCRDVLRGVATGWQGESADSKVESKENGGKQETFEPEWKRVVPKDKELRAYLRWMWLREGWVWDPHTGKKIRASEEIMREAELGDLAWRTKNEDKEGGLVVMKEVQGQSGNEAGSHVRDVVAEVSMHNEDAEIQPVEHQVLENGPDEVPTPTSLGTPLAPSHTPLTVAATTPLSSGLRKSRRISEKQGAELAEL